MSTTLKSGHEAVPLEGEELALQENLFRFYTEGMVRLNPGGWLLPTPFLKQADNIFEHKYRPRDVIVMTYPKCGTTWAQEIVWTMRNNPDLDHPEANEQILLRSPFIEGDFYISSRRQPPMGEDHPLIRAFERAFPRQEDTKGKFFSLTEAAPDPRVIKTHLPLSLFPSDLLETSKGNGKSLYGALEEDLHNFLRHVTLERGITAVLYVARNPLDVCVSFYYHSRLFFCHDYVGTFDQFVDLFVRDNLLYGPYLLHLKEAWAKKEHKNLHFMFYEDLKEDPLTELRKLDTFLETGLSEDRIRKIADYTSFSSMRARATDGLFPVRDEVAMETGGFFRKGKAGDWKVSVTSEQEERILAWMESGLYGEDLKFKHMGRA